MVIGENMKKKFFRVLVCLSIMFIAGLTGCSKDVKVDDKNEISSGYLSTLSSYDIIDKKEKNKIDVELNNDTIYISNEEKYDFTSFTTEDAMNFLIEENIQIPEGVKIVEGHEEIVLNIILEAYESLDYEVVYSDTEMYEFATEIIDKVHSYIE